MNQAEIESDVREYVVQELMGGVDRGLGKTSPLIEWGVIDSLNLMTLVTYLESRYDTKVPDDAMSADNFATIEHIARLIRHLVSSSA